MSVAQPPAEPGSATLPGGLRTVIVAGPGGVGKTTLAAAIAAGGCGRGLRVAVLTIDPARRLADALGLAEIGGRPHRVDPDAVAAAGLGAGELWAMTLDPKQTFDRTVELHAPDAAARDRILANPIYERISTALAGSQEYMAMEALYELVEEGGYDLVVLDTPPSQNAADFLGAPRRLIELIEGRAIRTFIRSAGVGSRIAGRGAAVMFRILRRITGVDLLRDLAEFFDALSGMIDGFRERAARVEALLGDPSSGFVLVTSPEPEPVAETRELRERLAEAGLPHVATCVNRIAPPPPHGDPQDLAATIAGRIDAADPTLEERLARTLDGLGAEHRRHAAEASRLAAEADGVPLLVLERLAGPVNDLDGLAELASALDRAAGSVSARRAQESDERR